MSFHRFPRRLLLGLVISLSLVSVGVNAYATTWSRSGTWWRLGLREWMTAHTIDFHLDGTVIVNELKGSCAEHSAVYTHVRSEQGTYWWDGSDTLTMVIDGQMSTYTVTEHQWYLELAHNQAEDYTGTYGRGGPGVQPCSY